MALIDRQTDETIHCLKVKCLCIGSGTADCVRVAKIRPSSIVPTIHFLTDELTMASNEPPEGRNNVPDAVRGPQTAVVATACQDGDCVDKDCYKVSFITVDGGKDKGREEEGSDDEEDEDGYENGEKALIEKWCKRLAWNLLDDEPFGQVPICHNEAYLNLVHRILILFVP